MVPRLALGFLASAQQVGGILRRLLRLFLGPLGAQQHIELPLFFLGALGLCRDQDQQFLLLIARLHSVEHRQMLVFPFRHDSPFVVGVDFDVTTRRDERQTRGCGCGVSSQLVERRT